MVNNFKINKYWIIGLCVLLGSLSSFAQESTDQEIGFNEARVIASLQEHGITNTDELNREIDQRRKIHEQKYIVIKKIKEEFLQRTPPKQLLKGTVDIPQSEKDALKALYDSTGGVNWKDKRGWDFNTPVTSWDSATQTGWWGIYLNSGHVNTIDLGYNNLNGQIPKEIGQLKYLTTLNIYNNQDLIGSIPEEFYNLQMLKFVYLSYNQLSGIISPSISKLTELASFNLNYNKLTGSIPREIRSINFCSLDLSNNQLTGSIPPEIGLSKNLLLVDLSDNNLNGTIPKEIGLLSNLRTLILNYNQCSGTLPAEIGMLKSLDWLLLGNNLLEGQIPNLSNLTELTLLQLSNNKFRFVDFISQFNSLKIKLNLSLLFTPQAKTDITETILSSSDKSVTLTMCEDGRFLADDTFQWYKNSTAIAGATSRMYAISNLKATDAGKYSCKSYHINNPDMSPLMLEREPITLTVGDCTPIVGAIKLVN
ncbi:hypothetical protein SD960_08400 [Flavobacterium sp. MMLR14_040]|uniref:hypothetical protein n=1 Tax=Flavobacterium sp. MMLR14_040 TaxID=3093843 RepID=UPI00298F5356|nr:hypothetical protein [Flavobacterium sp. MMLR14_040]MDW8850107.1 hypothetical protein [Flavobacterium sp. MMLR14_040]